jgi:hypothetical protein
MRSKTHTAPPRTIDEYLGRVSDHKRAALTVRCRFQTASFDVNASGEAPPTHTDRQNEGDRTCDTS